MPRARLVFHGPQRTAEVKEGAARGLFLAAEHVLALSTERVPLDEGPLQNSGTASVDEGALKAAISYETPYAVRQHEDMTYRHAPGRTSKYLESALNESEHDILALVAAQIRRTLR